MIPESKVRAWWNALTPAQRDAEALNLLGHEDPWDPWNVAWDELNPIGQQMQIHMYYDGKIQGKSRLNT